MRFNTSTRFLATTLGVMCLAAPAQADWRAEAQAAVDDGRYLEALHYISLAKANTPRDSALTAEKENIQAKLNDERNRLVKQAKSANAKGRRKQAGSIYRAVLAVDPNNKVARAALRKMERASTLTLIQKTNTQVQAAARQNERAKKTSAQEAAPKADPSLLQDAEAALARGDAAHAIAALEKHLQIEPKDSHVVSVLDAAYKRQADADLKDGEDKRALAYLEKRFALSKTKAAEADLNALRFQIADELYAEGLKLYDNDLERAIAIWRKAVETDPGHLEARRQLDEAIAVRSTLQSINEGM
ncbi:MAG: hypothetical protein AAGC95_03575 [Pseudomonadota bacterium]